METNEHATKKTREKQKLEIRQYFETDDNENTTFQSL